jgi:phosphate transport system protein
MSADNQGPEIRRAFHTDLDELSEDVKTLGELAVTAIKNGTNAFLAADMTAADDVIECDKAIDGLMVSIEMRACELLARQQPMAIDLRTILTILRTIHEIERCGDYMVNIAKATRRLYPLQLPSNLRHLIEKMRDQATVQLETAIIAFVERDVAKAHALQDMDDVMDDLQKDLLREVFESGDPNDSMQLGVQVALVGRYFERVADHAVNVGERVQFMVNGFAPIP